jgi:hypothetical protein
MSKSMVVALVALFFSLTGWGAAAKLAMTPANTVNTNSIVNGSIRLVDLHPSAVRALKGQRGEQGPQGLTGAPGPAGVAGGFDPGKVTFVGSGSAAVALGQSATAIATCPTGSRVIGGTSVAGAGHVVGEGPTANTTGWATVVVNDSLLSSISFSSTAVCAYP